MKKLILLFCLFTLTHTMDNSNNTNNVDPVIEENKKKLAIALHKIIIHLTPQLVFSNFIDGVKYISDNNELIALQLYLKNSQTQTLFTTNLPSNLKEEFKLAHEELKKHMPQEPSE